MFIKWIKFKNKEIKKLKKNLKETLKMKKQII